MRNPTRLGLAALLSVTGLFIACGDDTNSPQNMGFAGTAGTPSGGVGGSGLGGMMSAGTGFGAGTGGGGGESAGAGGTGAGTGGTGAGTAGTGTAGTGGTPPVVVPTVFLIDNVRLQRKVEGAGGDGGGGGVGGAGSAGDSGNTAGQGGLPDVGAGGLAAVGGDTGASAGAGVAGAPAGNPVPAELKLTFDTTLLPLAVHNDGFSPSVGGTAGPTILENTFFTLEAAGGNPGGAAKVSVPFTVAKQQADIATPFEVISDLTGFELLADVKLTGVGDIGACPTVWMYVWGGGYANDFSSEPDMGATNHLVKDEWQTVRLDLDGPYGYHSRTNHAGFKPTEVIHWGMQFNTWGCP